MLRDKEVADPGNHISTLKPPNSAQLVTRQDQASVCLPAIAVQRAYVERVIGTIRRECLDPMIVFNERCLYRHLQSFINYYHRSRTHLALEKDSPEPRPIQPPALGRIIAIPEVGGLHHRYERRAA